MSNGTPAARFRAAVEQQGGTVLGEYVNANTPVLVRCAEGHECRPWPSYITGKRAGRICGICSKRSRGSSEGRYRERVAELRGTILGEFVNTHTPVLVRCERGHEHAVTPNHVLRGTGICRICAGQDSTKPEASFRLAVEKAGGVVLGAYANSNTAVLIRCEKDHETRVQPNNVASGQGICRICRGRVWDVFYTVVDDVFEVLKFGVTSGDPRARLRNHRMAGFERVVRLHEQLPDGLARELEEDTKAALLRAGHKPVRGFEYFRARALPLVLGVVDRHPHFRH
ncbi:hypothetical protein ACWDBO_25565 [Streptomyces mirabilis]|uniref:hypothetical protein n=1 Tax=Streptomyces mirabilis TaxID=68239 RepID=UPI00332CE15A